MVFSSNAQGFYLAVIMATIQILTSKTRMDTCMERVLPGRPGPRIFPGEIATPPLPNDISAITLNTAAATVSRSLAESPETCYLHPYNHLEEGLSPPTLHWRNKAPITLRGGSSQYIANLWVVLLPMWTHSPLKPHPQTNGFPGWTANHVTPHSFNTHAEPLPYNFRALFSVLDPKTSEKAGATTTPVKGSTAPLIN